MNQLVPTVRTTPTALLFAKAVLAAWQATGEEAPPSKAAVALLYAHYMLETGGLNCYNFNIGNVKHVDGDGYDYHCLKGVWEGASTSAAQQLVASGQATYDTNVSHQKSCAPNVSVVFQPPHPATRFRAFPSLDDAMVEHLNMLKFKRYASAWPALMAGDVMRFALALKSRGYMTSSAEAYGNGMTPPFHHFMIGSDYEEALNVDVTEPVYEFSGGIIHPSIEFEPIVYDLTESDYPPSSSPS